MNRENILSAINKAVVETMEEMAFIQFYAIDEPNLTSASDRYCRKVFLQTHYPLAAEFILELPEDLLKEITLNIYGIDLQELTTDQENDVLAEILNTIAGSVMKNIIPSEFSYDLGIPKLDFDECKFAKDKTKIKCAFKSEEEQYIWLSIYI